MEFAMKPAPKPMALSKAQQEAVGFYDQHYRIVFDSSLKAGN
jgi:hypothetical protein